MEGEAGHLLHRVQLHAPPGQRLPVALRARRLRAAGGRLRPVGQHHRRHRPHPPHAGPTGLRADLAPAHQGRRHEVRQDRRRRRLARPGRDQPVPVPPVLGAGRRRRGGALPPPVHPAAGRRGPVGHGRSTGEAPERRRRPAHAGPGAHRARPRRRRPPRPPRPPPTVLFGGRSRPRRRWRPSRPCAAEVPRAPSARLDQLDDVVALLVSTGLASSNSDARRTLGQRGITGQRAPARRRRRPGRRPSCSTAGTCCSRKGATTYHLVDFLPG